MAAPTDMNPLCQTELCKALFEVGRNHSNRFPISMMGRGTRDLLGFIKEITGPAHAPVCPAVLASYIILENLKLALEPGVEGGLLSPILKLEDRVAACERTHLEIATGASPEFNELIGRVVEQKVQEVLSRQAGSSTDVDDEPVQKVRKKTTEEKIQQAKIAIDQQIAELNDLVLPGLTSDEGRVKTKILNKSLEVQTFIRNSAVDVQERNRRLHVWIAYLIKKNGQRLSQLPVPRGPFWEVVERMRQSASILIYNLEKLG